MIRLKPLGSNSISLESLTFLWLSTHKSKGKVLKVRHIHCASLLGYLAVRQTDYTAFDFRLMLQSLLEGLKAVKTFFSPDKMIR